MLIGSSPVMQTLRSRIEQVAQSDMKVLVVGPTGAGKELVAQEIHRLSRRSSKPLVTINCAALTESLLEAELFGFKRGSFTGANEDRVGRLESAHSSTLFLDEVGDMSLTTQARVLRFIESGEIQPVGMPNRRVDVRLVTATNRDLRQMVSRGEFREDLYHRICGVRLKVPSLNEHLSDIPELVNHFTAALAQNNGHGLREIPVEIQMVLQNHSWSGNVRELRNMVEKLLYGYTWGLSDLSVQDATVKTDASTVNAGNSEIAERLYLRMVDGGKSFWDVVQGPFTKRELASPDLRILIHLGLERAHGMYTVLCQHFNVQSSDYKRFMTFLRKYKLKPENQKRYRR